jgi:hypothetical protein
MAKSTDSYNRMVTYFDTETIEGVNTGAKQGRGEITRPKALENNEEEVLSEEEQFIEKIPPKAGYKEGINQANEIVKKRGFWN